MSARINRLKATRPKFVYSTHDRPNAASYLVSSSLAFPKLDTTSKTSGNHATHIRRPEDGVQ